MILRYSVVQVEPRKDTGSERQTWYKAFVRFRPRGEHASRRGQPLLSPAGEEHQTRPAFAAWGGPRQV